MTSQNPKSAFGASSAAGWRTELEQFVSQVQSRLDSLSKSLADCQLQRVPDEPAETQQQQQTTIPTFQPELSEETGAADDHRFDDDVVTPETETKANRTGHPENLHTEPRPEPADEARVPAVLERAEPVLPETGSPTAAAPANDEHDPTDRLAAIKLRLAKQIENA